MLSRSLLFWLALFEWLAARNGWAGLSWRRPGARAGLPALLVGAALVAGHGGRARRALWLGLAAPFALALQLGASSLRGRRRDPLARLKPGQHADRRVIDLQIGMRQGYLPAILAEPRAGAHMAVAILHGSGDHKTAYTWWMVDALLSQGLAALLVDLDGHGESPRVQRYPETLEDVAAATEWLRARYPRVGVLGLSLGGCIAARAVAEGARADALVIMEAPPRLIFSRADMRREALALLTPHGLALFRDCTALQLARAWSTKPLRVAISTWDMIDALDLLGSLPRIGAPLLLLYGARDAIVKPAQAAQVRAAMPAHAEFRLVPGASHLTLFVRRDVQASVAAWLARALQPTQHTPPRCERA